MATHTPTIPAFSVISKGYASLTNLTGLVSIQRALWDAYRNRLDSWPSDYPSIGLWDAYRDETDAVAMHIISIR